MKNYFISSITTLVLIVAALAALAIGSTASQAAITLVNGGFEDIGVQYSTQLGGLYEASGWTNVSGLDIQASSALIGVEGTDDVFMQGDRFLRLASDDPAPQNQGAITQNLGTMTAGETYTFTADVFGGASIDTPWAASASFVNAGVFDPSVTYATSFAVAFNGQTFLSAFNMTYTATAADDGQSLFLLLKAAPSFPFSDRRGGIDNATVSVTSVAVPEANTHALVAGMLPVIGCAAALRRRKKMA